MILATDTALVTIDENRKFLETVPYAFSNPRLYNPARRWKNLQPVPASNKPIIHDEGRFLVYNTGTRRFSTVPLEAEGAGLYFCMAEDKSGAAFYYYNKAIYKLSPENKVTLWKGKEGMPAYGFVSMLIDNSGVLWMGSNGSGIHLFDMRLSRITGKPYERSFHENVLYDHLGIPASEINQTFLNSSDSYYFRWMEDGSGKIWLSWAVPDPVAKPQAWFYKNGHIVKPPWHFTDTASATHASINAMAVSRSGKVWG